MRMVMRLTREREGEVDSGGKTASGNEPNAKHDAMLAKCCLSTMAKRCLDGGQHLILFCNNMAIKRRKELKISINALASQSV
jgi:hypothetical protein